jgi:Family of unknown function (DUF6011)
VTSPPKREEGRAPHHQDDRPSTNSFSSHDATDTNKDILSDSAQPVRCQRCKKPLHTAVSQFLGLGPVCRRHVLDAELSHAVGQFADELVVA